MAGSPGPTAHSQDHRLLCWKDRTQQEAAKLTVALRLTLVGNEAIYRGLGMLPPAPCPLAGPGQRPPIPLKTWPQALDPCSHTAIPQGGMPATRVTSLGVSGQMSL